LNGINSFQMATIDFGNMTVGGIVAADFRTAQVFTHAGIDFCCGGKKGLAESCLEVGADPDQLRRELEEAVSTAAGAGMNFSEWDPGFLCDYIMNTHHKFVLKNLPDLVFYTGKIARVHGEHHPELMEIAALFTDINHELLQHLRNEEEVLFPAIRRSLAGVSASDRETVISEITRMAAEHEFAGGAMDRIGRISGRYNVPADGCGTYDITYKLLQQFEEDLHIHVHLENNILYPKALALTEG
jgi:regulator of cell morphogenesis and NO signaling